MILLNLNASSMEGDNDFSISLNKEMLLHPPASGARVLQQHSYDLCCISAHFYSAVYLFHVM